MKSIELVIIRADIDKPISYGWRGMDSVASLSRPEWLADRRMAPARPERIQLVIISVGTFSSLDSCLSRRTETVIRQQKAVSRMELARHPQTILAYEMNGQSLPLEHGAPLRLRVETQLGYKMVKYLRSIALVEDYKCIGKGRGGFREDFQYYGRTAEI